MSLEVITLILSGTGILLVPAIGFVVNKLMTLSDSNSALIARVQTLENQQMEDSAIRETQVAQMATLTAITETLRLEQQTMREGNTAHHSMSVEFKEEIRALITGMAMEFREALHKMQLELALLKRDHDNE